MKEVVCTLFFMLDLSALRELISDTYTLIAGFVAIGIPLSMQAVERAALRYKSPHLVTYLSSWRWITPARIIWLSFGYVALSLLVKYLLPNESPQTEQITAYVYALAWLQIFYFIGLFSAVGCWYSHLLAQLHKRPVEVFNDLSS